MAFRAGVCILVSGDHKDCEVVFERIWVVLQNSLSVLCQFAQGLAPSGAIWCNVLLRVKHMPDLEHTPTRCCALLGLLLGTAQVCVRPEAATVITASPAT